MWSPSLGGNSTRLPGGGGESGHPHLVGILPDCQEVEVNLVTLTWWEFYQIARRWR